MLNPMSRESYQDDLLADMLFDDISIEGKGLVGILLVGNLQTDFLPRAIQPLVSQQH